MRAFVKPILSILVVDFLQQKLDPAHFRESTDSQFGGLPLLLELWNQLDFSILLTQCGIFKVRGLATWKLAFAFVASMICHSSSDLKRLEFWNQDALLQTSLKVSVVTQSVLSRFLNLFSQWPAFNLSRVRQLQTDPQYALVDGDVIALDDTLIPHQYAKKLPFLCKLFDHSLKTYVMGINLLATHAIKQDGREYPLFYSFWDKPDPEEAAITKLDLALQQLRTMRNLLPPQLRLWVSMDRWFFSKPFCLKLEAMGFDWVTKAKRNTVFYRKISNKKGKPRFTRVTTREILCEAYAQMPQTKDALPNCLAIPDLYMKTMEPNPEAKGRKINRALFSPVSGVVVKKLTEDESEESRRDSTSPDPEAVAQYKDVFLLVSNRQNAPDQVVKAYQKRWRIELLFRNAKSELGLNECHSRNENHLNAHVALLFTAETLVRRLEWEYNATVDPKLRMTHGEVIIQMFRTHCMRSTLHSHHGTLDVVRLHFPIRVRKLASFFKRFWPRQITLGWFDSLPDCKVSPSSG